MLQPDGFADALTLALVVFGAHLVLVAMLLGLAELVLASWLLVRGVAVAGDTPTSRP